jgi:hypothetical protein
MSQIFNKLYDQSFIDFYYSNAMWYNCVEDKTWAQTNVLVCSGITAEACDYIYNDPQYGMNSIRNFCIWIRAALGDSAAEIIL